jgi:hypothetical protein
MIILIQIGRKKTNSWSHNISAKLITKESDETLDISWNDFKGQWLSQASTRLYECFYLAEVEAEEGDKIELTTFAKKSLGVVEDLCLKEIYLCSDEYEVKEFTHKKLEYKGYPIIKGRVQKIASYSKLDARDSASRFKLENTEF